MGSIQGIPFSMATVWAKEDQRGILVRRVWPMGFQVQFTTEMYPLPQ